MKYPYKIIDDYVIVYYKTKNHDLEILLDLNTFKYLSEIKTHFNITQNREKVPYVRFKKDGKLIFIHKVFLGIKRNKNGR